MDINLHQAFFLFLMGAGLAWMICLVWVARVHTCGKKSQTAILPVALFAAGFMLHANLKSDNRSEAVFSNTTDRHAAAPLVGADGPAQQAPAAQNHTTAGLHAAFFAQSAARAAELDRLVRAKLP